MGPGETLTVSAPVARHEDIKRLSRFITYGDTYRRAIADDLRDCSRIWQRAEYPELADERFTQIMRRVVEADECAAIAEDESRTAVAQGPDDAPAAMTTGSRMVLTVARSGVPAGTVCTVTAIVPGSQWPTVQYHGTMITEAVPLDQLAPFVAVAEHPAVTHVRTMLADLAAIRGELAEIDAAEHPDVTDRFGRVWTWWKGELYHHDDTLADTRDRIAAYGLPPATLADNHNYAGLCTICRQNWTPAQSAKVDALHAAMLTYETARGDDRAAARQAYLDATTADYNAIEPSESAPESAATPDTVTVGGYASWQVRGEVHTVKVCSLGDRYSAHASLMATDGYTEMLPRGLPAGARPATAEEIETFERLRAGRLEPVAYE